MADDISKFDDEGDDDAKYQKLLALKQSLNLSPQQPSGDDVLADIMAKNQAPRTEGDPTTDSELTDQALRARMSPTDTSLNPAYPSKPVSRTPNAGLGEIPQEGDDDSEDDDDDSDDEDNSDSKTPANPRKAALQTMKQKLDIISGKAPDSQRQSVSDMLSTLMSGQNDDLQNAINHRNQSQLTNNLARAGDTINAGFAGHKLDESFYDEANKQANQPIEDLSTKNKLTDDKLKQQGELYKLQDAGDANDAGSYRSQVARQLATEASKRAGLNINIPDTASASDLDTYMKGIDSMASRKIQSDQAKAMRDLANATKTDHYQDMAMQKTQAQLASNRGDPAVQQAQKDMYAAKKVNDLINLYPDPNNMPIEQVHTLVAEQSKIATGGVPAQADIVASMPDYWKQKLSKVWANLQNEPTPANAAAFIAQQQAYVNAMASTAQDLVKEKYGKVIESSKRQLKPEDYDTLNEQWVKPFTLIKPTSKTAPGKLGEGGPSQKITVSNGTDSYQIDPSDLPHAVADGYKKVQ